MHKVDFEMVEMTLDVMKYAIGRITHPAPELGKPKKEEELKTLVGETITPDGIGGEKAFQLFKEVLIKATRSVLDGGSRRNILRERGHEMVGIPNWLTKGVFRGFYQWRNGCQFIGHGNSKGELAEESGKC